MTEEEWERHLDYLDNVEISPYSITVGGSQHYGHRQVVPYLFVSEEERIEMSVIKDNILNDTQRAELLQLYKEKLTQLGDDKFFEQFDAIREECYGKLGVEIQTLSDAATQLGRRGGESTSEAKSSASRSNGARGGRPRSRSNQVVDMDDI